VNTRLLILGAGFNTGLTYGYSLVNLHKVTDYYNESLLASYSLKSQKF